MQPHLTFKPFRISQQSKASLHETSPISCESYDSVAIKQLNTALDRTLCFPSHPEWEEYKLIMISSLPMQDSFFEKAPCMNHYKNNSSCSFGDRCHYSHSSVCRFYQKGSCKFGNKCKYLHLDFSETKSVRELKVLLNSATEIQNDSSLNWFLRKKNPLEQDNMKANIEMVGVKPNGLIHEQVSHIVDMVSNNEQTFFVMLDGTVWSSKNQTLINGMQGKRSLTASKSSSLDWNEWTQINKESVLPIATLERVPFSREEKDHNISKAFTNSNIFTGSFSYFLTCSGAVYSQGVNACGQLGKGLSDRRDSFIPTRVGNPLTNEKICHVSLGSDHVALLNTKGEVYTCGLNESGQCGTGDNTQNNFNWEFSKMSFNFKTEGDYIIDISCCCDSTICLSKFGECFGSGRNTFGELGIPLDQTLEKKIVLNFTKIDFPFESDPNSTDRIVNVSCSDHSTAFLTAQGKVYVSGKNRYGQLGIPQSAMILRPVLVLLGKFVKQVFRTGFRTFFITSDNEIFVTGEHDLHSESSNNMTLTPLNSLVFPNECDAHKWDFVNISSVNGANIFMVKKNNLTAINFRNSMKSKSDSHQLCDIVII